MTQFTMALWLDVEASGKSQINKQPVQVGLVPAGLKAKEAMILPAMFSDGKPSAKGSWHTQNLD